MDSLILLLAVPALYFMADSLQKIYVLLHWLCSHMDDHEDETLQDE